MTTETDIYTAYYMSNSNIYSSPAFQRGMGVGNFKDLCLINEFFQYKQITFTSSFLSGLFRAVIPIVKKGTSALGQELLRIYSVLVLPMMFGKPVILRPHRKKGEKNY